jgi:5-methylcytosine-specific restriction protein A
MSLRARSSARTTFMNIVLEHGSLRNANEINGVEGVGRNLPVWGSSTGPGHVFLHVQNWNKNTTVGIQSLPVRPPIHRPTGWRPKVPWEHRPGRETAESRGYGTDWRKLRAEVLAEEPFCRECAGSGLRVRATHVDHIVPKFRGGEDVKSNLRPLCAPCHLSKSGREGRENRG